MIPRNNIQTNVREHNFENLSFGHLAHYGATFIGVPVAHSYSEIFVIDYIFSKHQLTHVVEIGVWFGGLTKYLLCLSNGKYLGFDIEDARYDSVKDIFKRFPESKFIISNILTTNVTPVVKTFSENSKTLFYLDNGNKYKEVMMFLPLMKSGDVLIAHDYKVEWNVDEEMSKAIEQNSVIKIDDDILQGLESAQAIFIKE